MSALEPRRDHVVVGVDGSPPSLLALQWAHRQAELWQAGLEVVVAWPSGTHDDGFVHDQAQAREVATAALASLDDAGAEVEVWVPAQADHPETVLLRRAERARLLVLGPHARHTVAERVLGTVTERVLARATNPVAVVQEHDGHAARGRIVVGVDDSAAASSALCWAAGQARLTGSQLLALHVWDWQPEYTVPPYGSSTQEQQARAEAALAASLTALPEEDQARVRAEAVRGNAVPTLLAAAKSADLLVVGTRHPGRLASRLPGHVTHAVTTHAAVPVVVVPAEAPQRR